MLQIAEMRAAPDAQTAVFIRIERGGSEFFFRALSFFCRTAEYRPSDDPGIRRDSRRLFAIPYLNLLKSGEDDLLALRIDDEREILFH